MISNTPNKSISERLKKKRKKKRTQRILSFEPTQKSELKAYWDASLKQATHAELKQFCKEGWSKIPSQWYERLIDSHH